MPVRVRPRRPGETGKPFKLVDIETGKVEAESDTRAKADAAARARNAAHRRKVEGKSLDSGLILLPLVKFATRTSRDGGHDHRLELPEQPQAGTFVTRPARSAGASQTHVHVVVIRPGSRRGQKIVSSPGVDGHTHKVVLGHGLAKAADISGDNAAQVSGHDSTRRESLEGARRKRAKRKGKRSMERGRDLLRSALADGLTLLCKQTKREQGKDFPARDFAYVPDRSKPSTWKLRLTESPGAAPTRAQVGRAVAALGPGGFRGQRVQIPRADLGAVKRRVAAAFRKVNPGRDLPPVLRA